MKKNVSKWEPKCAECVNMLIYTSQRKARLWACLSRDGWSSCIHSGGNAAHTKSIKDSASRKWSTHQKRDIIVLLQAKVELNVTFLSSTLLSTLKRNQHNVAFRNPKCYYFMCHIVAPQSASASQAGIPPPFWPSRQACRRSCMSMFANRTDRATAVRQTQNTNINTQTDSFIHIP